MLERIFGSKSIDASNTDATVTTKPLATIFLTKEEFDKRLEILVEPIASERKTEFKEKITRSVNLQFIIANYEAISGIARKNESSDRIPLIPNQFIDWARNLMRHESLWSSETIPDEQIACYSNMIVTLSSSADISVITPNYLCLCAQLKQVLENAGYPCDLAEQIAAGIVMHRLSSDKHYFEEEDLKHLFTEHYEVGTKAQRFAEITKDFADLTELPDFFCKITANRFIMNDGYRGSSDCALNAIKRQLEWLNELYETLAGSPYLKEIKAGKLALVIDFVDSFKLVGFSDITGSRFGMLSLDYKDKYELLCEGVTDELRRSVFKVIANCHKNKAEQEQEIEFDIIFNQKFNLVLNVLKGLENQDRINALQYVLSPANREHIFESPQLFRRLIDRSNAGELPTTYDQLTASQWLNFITAAGDIAKDSNKAQSWVNRTKLENSRGIGFDYSLYKIT